MNHGPTLLHTFMLGALAISCENFEPAAPADDALLDGPVSGLTEAERIRFLKGDIAFNDEIFVPQNGLGPLFVASSCGSCHPGDGKGHPFTSLTRFGQMDETGNQYTHVGGPQLQNRAIPGYQPEKLPSNVKYTKLTPPANSGLGFVDAVSDEDIIQWSDPDDSDGDGVSGVPNWIAKKNYVYERPGAMEMNGKYIGRFGKKALRTICTNRPLRRIMRTLVLHLLSNRMTPIPDWKQIRKLLIRRFRM